MSKDDILFFLGEVVGGKVPETKKVKFLENFTFGKISPEDIATFAEFMEAKMPHKLKMPGAIDICGTGGSGLPRINTSTIATFILAELGVPMAKHGNKAASGRFGSFDLLEELGIDIEKSAEELEKIFEKKGLAFIYARKFHPVMKHFAEARKAIGEPTIFNILGPLLNPANPQKQIIGTSFKDQMRMMAEACKLMGKEHVMIVRGSDGLDEVTMTGLTKVVEMKDGNISEYSITPKDFGVEECEFEKIAGGDAAKNIRVAKKILNGEGFTERADLVYINCALALKLVGKVDALKEGYRLSKDTDGISKLEAYKGNILNEIVASKSLKQSDRSFFDALSKDGVSVIAEIKKASPSEGQIFNGDFDAGKIAKDYEDHGASAISILTDEKYFDGKLQFMKDARAATSTTPILCKDFITQEYQIHQAREFGADAILLIAALLDRGKMQRFINIADDLGMDCLVEIHNEEELLNVLTTDAKIIGINNRNLKTFEVDLETTNRLSKMVPKGRLVVSESGIKGKEDVDSLTGRVDAILVGTTLMRAKNITNKLNEIT